MAPREIQLSTSRFEQSQVEMATITPSVETGESSEKFSEIQLNGFGSFDGRHVNGDAGVSLPTNRSRVALALSSLVAAGVQFGWALQLSLLTPYIQKLGVRHAFSSFIWLCGPITGLVVQPCVGIWSDKCTLKYGRRRPFIFAGSILICLAVTLIGFAADIGRILGDTKELCATYKGTRPFAIGVFTLGFWLLDLANNTVQGPARALLADLSGPHQRDYSNAIFALWMALGNVLGFSAGASGRWESWFPFLESRACCGACLDLKAAFLVAVVFLAICTSVTLLFAKEAPLAEKFKQSVDAVPLLHNKGEKQIEFSSQSMEVTSHMFEADHSSGETKDDAELAFEIEVDETDSIGTGPGAVLINLLTSIRRLPPEMKSVLMVMALCWFSWFPFLLFDTDWMGREVYQGDPLGAGSKPDYYERGVRAGTFGLLLNSVVLGISTFLIDPVCRWIGTKYVWAASNFVTFVCMASTALVSTLAGHKAAHGAAVAIFALLGLPLAITYSVPYSVTAELTADSGGGQGLAMGVLNLAVVIPQMIVALGSGPWDALFGGGNEPAFALAAIFAFVAGVVALVWLPRLSEGSYKPASGHGFG